MIVRSMRRADASRVAALSGQLGYAASAAEIERRFDELAGQSDHALIVLEDGSGAVAGFLHVAATPGLIHERMAEIHALVVDESARGAGAGARLVAAAEEWSRARGLPRLRVRTQIVRERAHAFYERLDFRRAKTQHVFDKDLMSGR
jgi:GNAT superfamily N-acetyltransferase